jgi:hypothetical protein
LLKNSYRFASLIQTKLTVQLKLAMLGFSFSDPLDKLLAKSAANMAKCFNCLTVFTLSLINFSTGIKNYEP